MGTVKYVPERDAILWYIPKFQGAREYLMRAHFGLPSTTSEDLAQAKPPITVKFEIPYFTVSGIQVRYLKIIERSGYQVPTSNPSTLSVTAFVFSASCRVLTLCPPLARLCRG